MTNIHSQVIMGTPRVRIRKSIFEGTVNDMKIKMKAIITKNGFEPVTFKSRLRIATRKNVLKLSPN